MPPMFPDMLCPPLRSASGACTRRCSRLAPLLAGLLAIGVTARPAAAQQQPEAPPPPAAKSAASEEGGSVLLQILAGVGIGGAAVAGIWFADSKESAAGVWSLVALTPPAVGLAVCNLGGPSERSEPSCLRAVVASYIGSLIAVPVFIVTLMAALDWGPATEENTADNDRDIAIMVGATSVAWVGGMTAGAAIFGRRPRAALPPAPPPPAAQWPAGFAPTDDPRQPRWASGRLSNQLVFPLLSVAF